MKSINLAYILYFALISAFLFSCSSIKQQDESEETALPSYYYKTFRINSTKPLADSDTTYFIITYPEFSDSKINEYVQRHLVLDSGANSVADMGKKFIGEYDKLYNELEYKWPWYQDKRDSVEVQTESYIGFSTHFESYTGGAHGVHYIYYNNYSVNQNRELLINDIVADEFQASLTKVGEDIFRKQEGISDNQSLTDDYFFNEGIFSLPHNFILQKDGILFLYNIYEIKAYVFGNTQLFIPYTSISDMLTTEGKEIMAEIKLNFNANI